LLFNSFQFAFFFVPVLALYCLADHKWQNRLLLIAGYLFYGAWDWRFLGLLMLSTCLDFAIGWRIGLAQGSQRRAWILASIGVNLTILGFFKYFNFFAQSFADLVSLFGLHVSPFALHVVLPVGISFYTFQALSYTINVYRRRMPPASSLLDFALYVSFFPQLVAGPIEKSHNLLPQMQNPRTVTLEGIYEGAYLVFWGLCKKVFVADNIARIVDAIFRGNGDHSGFEYLIGAYAFTWQIYTDFSGYSDIAKGLARMMGFTLMVNFDTPLFARNLIDFWHRWHISLSTWFRDYVFIPLGGSRVSRSRRALNLMIVFLVSGLWHGAASKFIIWGGVHGIAQVALSLHGNTIDRALSWIPTSMRRVVGVILTFHFVAFAFVLWQTDGLVQWLGVMRSIFADFRFSGASAGQLGKLAAFVALPFAYEFAQQSGRDIWMPLRWTVPRRALLYAVFLFCLVRFGAFEGEQFIYFQF